MASPDHLLHGEAGSASIWAGPESRWLVCDCRGSLTASQPRPLLCNRCISYVSLGRDPGPARLWDACGVRSFEQVSSMIRCPGCREERVTRENAPECSLSRTTRWANAAPSSRWGRSSRLLPRPAPVTAPRAPAPETLLSPSFTLRRQDQHPSIHSIDNIQTAQYVSLWVVAVCGHDTPYSASKSDWPLRGGFRQHNPTLVVSKIAKHIYNLDSLG
jgi:hypothetical protein